jgi:hypothetical protein
VFCLLNIRRHLLCDSLFLNTLANFTEDGKLGLNFTLTLCSFFNMIKNRFQNRTDIFSFLWNTRIICDVQSWVYIRDLMASCLVGCVILHGFLASLVSLFAKLFLFEIDNFSE